MNNRFARLIVLLALVFLLLPNSKSFASDNVFTFKDVPKNHWSEKYIYRLKFLEVIQGNGNDSFGFNKNISRGEFTTMLMRLVGQNSQSDESTIYFEDVPASHWAYPHLLKAVQQKVILPEEYPDRNFRLNESINRMEMAIMIVRALKCDDLLDLAKNADSGFKDVPIFSNYVFIAKEYGIVQGKSSDSFKPYDLATRQEAAAMLVRLVDILYKQDTYPLNIIDPISGHQYRDKLSVEVQTPNEISGFINKMELQMNNNKIVHTFTSAPYTCELNVSGFAPGYHSIKAIAYTKDGFKLESFPVTINLSKSDNDGFDNYRTAEKDSILNSHIYLENKYALVNSLEPTPSNDRKLFISNTPERILKDTNPVLFDSNRQSGNFRLMFYHENQTQTQITLGIEIENLGSEDLYLTENSGYCSGLYGNSAGYYSQEFFMKVKNDEQKTFWDPNYQVRSKIHTIPPHSRLILFQDAITQQKVASFIGDFDVSGTESYIVKVGYTKSLAPQALANAFSDGLRAAPDRLHSRGVFPAADFDINIDLSVPSKNICFQIGNDSKLYDSEANVHPLQIGYNHDGIVVNDGHFGELFNVILNNPEGKPFMVAIEFRGSRSISPSFPVYYDSNGLTQSTVVSKESALYIDRQLVIGRTSEQQVKYTLGIPPGANGPLYIYIIKDVKELPNS